MFTGIIRRVPLLPFLNLFYNTFIDLIVLHNTLRADTRRRYFENMPLRYISCSEKCEGSEGKPPVPGYHDVTHSVSVTATANHAEVGGTVPTQPSRLTTTT